MLRSTIAPAVVVAGAALAFLSGVAADRSSAAAAATTTFKGRFVCGDEPLAGARVELLGEPRVHSSLLGTDFKVGFTVRGTRYASSQGEWSFNVPRTKDTNYYVQVYLDDGRGTIVTDYPNTGATAAVPGAGGTNFNDVPVQDYHSQAYPGEECGLWLALEDAYQDYARLMGKRPPYGDLVAQYDGPNRGTPYAAHTTIVWPRGSTVSDAGARHEFAHTIRNASLGSESAFLDEVSQEDFRLRGGPCRRTSAQYAFHEGWAGFWAGDYAPAPSCAGVKADDPAVEGNVAWTLTRLERNCTIASRKRMVQMLLAQGKKIHSLADFVRALGVGSALCLGAPHDPAAVPRTTASPPVSDKLWMRDLEAGLTSIRRRESTLGKLLPRADRAAVSARCPNPPCLEAIARRVAPSLIRGQIAAARTSASTLQTALTIDATSLRGRATRQFLDSLTMTPPTLAKRLAKIGVDSIDKVLAAARPLATRDRSSATRSVLQVFRSQRSALVHVAHSGAGVHAYHSSVAWGCYWFACWPGWSEEAKQTSIVPTVYRHEVRFERFGPGTPITTQTARDGATFGSATALGFRGALPKYVCPAGPTAFGFNVNSALAPLCDAPDVGLGFSHSGTLARLRFPARSVAVSVSATAVTPAGLPAEVDAFDAQGTLVGRNAVLVGAAYQGERDKGPRLLTLTPALHSRPIVFVALFVNNPISAVRSGVGPDSALPRLAFASFSWEERPR